MSKEALEEVLRRASNDSGFRSRLSGDLEVTVRSYDLTDAEKVQLRSATVDRAAATRSVPERQAADTEAADTEAADTEAADTEAADTEAADTEAMNTEQM